MSAHWNSLARAYGDPVALGRLKVDPEDFRVDEWLGFELDGRGEHCAVDIRATGHNTAHVARILASWAGIPVGHVSFCGQKDRHAVTRQWFTLHMPGKPDPDPARLEVPGVELMGMTRHGRKLKRGAHAGNVFAIRLRDVSVASAPYNEWVAERLARMACFGVPNYVGPQRFGRDESNLTGALTAVRLGEWPRDRERRGWFFSALRSALFNGALSQRVADGTWNVWIPGDLLQGRGHQGFFRVGDDLEDVRARLNDGVLSVAGILPGGEDWLVTEQALIGLNHVWQDHLSALDALRRQGLGTDVRAYRVWPEGLSHRWENNDLWLDFRLPRGSFATAVLRELLNLIE